MFNKNQSLFDGTVALVARLETLLNGAHAVAGIEAVTGWKTTLLALKGFKDMVFHDLTAPIERDVAEKNLREIIEEWERVPKDMEVAKTRAAALESAVKVGTLLCQAEEIITSERSWGDKYDLIFSDSISSEFQRLMPDFTWYDPDTSYEEDVRSWFEAAKRYGRDPQNHPLYQL